MSKIQLLPVPVRAVVTLLLLALADFWAAPGALAQVINASPPERMTYPGFLADGNGAALATNGPTNYNVVFRIMDAQTGGNTNWAEPQTVTVDKGYFSVLLGEGSAIASSVEPHPAISTLFAAANASDRYMEMTVKAPSPLGATDVKILPRLRLLTSPYAFLATSATKLVSSSGSDLITSPSAGVVTINGTVNATTITGNGSGLTGLTNTQIPNLDASKITTGALADARLSSNVALHNGGNSFTGDQFINSGTLYITGAGSYLYCTGDLKFGAGGAYSAVGSGPESLRIVRGVVASGGGAAQGSGYTSVRNSAGAYAKDCVWVMTGGKRGYDERAKRSGEKSGRVD